jgi:hypothetical protein
LWGHEAVVAVVVVVKVAESALVDSETSSLKKRASWMMNMEQIKY